MSAGYVRTSCSVTVTYLLWEWHQQIVYRHLQSINQNH